MLFLSLCFNGFCSTLEENASLLSYMCIFLSLSLSISINALGVCRHNEWQLYALKKCVLCVQREDESIAMYWTVSCLSSLLITLTISPFLLLLHWWQREIGRNKHITSLIILLFFETKNLSNDNSSVNSIVIL